MPGVEVVLPGYNLGSDQGRFGFSGIYLLRGRRTILVDTSHVGRREHLQMRLRDMRLAPRDIDMVVLTHAHWDHMLNVDLFPGAEILIHPHELEYARSPHPDDWATPSYAGAILDRLTVRPVREGQELDEGVWVMETPGHTWGSLSVVVDDGASVAGIVGDALPNARAALQRMPYLIFGDERDARQSAERIVERCTVLYPGHDRPFELGDGATRYLGGVSLVVTGTLEPSESDVAVTIAATPPRGLWKLDRPWAPKDG